MNVLFQIALGSGLLLLCLAIHISVAARLVMFVRTRKPMRRRQTTASFVRLLALISIVFLMSHTVHIYIWAASLWVLRALPGYEEPLYFILVTYATLGYGDVILQPGYRIFGAMASVCGILMFGLTTAFVVGFLGRFLEMRGEK